jgi:hypothetical protein
MEKKMKKESTQDEHQGFQKHGRKIPTDYRNHRRKKDRTFLHA